jgi:DnaK suppressor protein
LDVRAVTVAGQLTICRYQAGSETTKGLVRTAVLDVHLMAEGTTMTKTELNGFRTALENKLAELGTTSREPVAIETSADELDRIQHASERDYAMGNLERNSTRLREVHNAFRRIDAGTFGICGVCEEDIAPRRLAAVPWASLCITCQDAADRAKKTPQTEIDSPLELAA